MPTILLHVTGMRGAADEDRVQAMLRAEPGVLAAIASHRNACAEVEIEDDQVTFQRLIELIEAAGFHATLAG